MSKMIVKGLSLITLLIGISFALLPAFIYVGPTNRLRAGLYDTDEIFDVLLVGSSHMLNGLSPNYLFTDYGFTSYVFATGGQRFDVNYYFLKEALKKQKPKVVVLELYFAADTSEYSHIGYTRNALNCLTPSANKLEAILSLTSPDSWLYYLFPFLEYHSNWTDVNINQYKKNSYENYFLKGFTPEMEIWGAEDSYTPKNDGIKAEILPKTKKYIDLFIELGTERSFDLLFTLMPFDINETIYNDPGYYNDAEALYNGIEYYLSYRGYTMFNYNKTQLRDAIELDFPNDMLNGGHMNINGTAKVSKHVGQYLSETYNLPDYRNDSDFAIWHEYAERQNQLFNSD